MSGGVVGASGPGLVKKLAEFITDARTVLTIAAGAVVIVFLAGAYYADASKQVLIALDQVKKHEELLASGQLARSDQLARVQDEVVGITTALNDGRFVQPDQLASWGQQTASDRLSGLDGGTTYPPTVCPEGSYLVGIESQGSPPGTRYCIGCLISVRAICRQLPR